MTRGWDTLCDWIGDPYVVVSSVTGKGPHRVAIVCHYFCTRKQLVNPTHSGEIVVIIDFRSVDPSFRLNPKRSVSSLSSCKVRLCCR